MFRISNIVLSVLWLVIGLLVSIAGCNASDSPVLTLSADKPLPLLGYLEYAIDAENPTPFKHIYRGQHNLVFTPLMMPSIPAIKQTTWFRFRVHNPYSEKKQFIVDFQECLFDKLTFIIPHKQEFIQYNAGLDVPYHDRPIDHRFIAMPLTLDAGEELTVYFSIYTSQYPLLFPTISSPLNFATQAATSDAISLTSVGLAMGICIFILIFIPIAIPARETYSYIAFVWASTAVIAGFSGYYQLLFADNPDLHKFLLVALFSINCMTNLFMVNTFFEVYRKNPWLHKFYVLMGAVFLLFIISYPFVGGYRTLILPLIQSTLLMYCLLFYTAIGNFLQGFKHSGLFLSAIALFFISSCIAIAGSYGLIPYSPVVRHGIGSGIILQSAIICFAMARKVASHQKKTEQLEKNIAIAHEASREKSDFLAAMSHEIRTPVNGVLGMAQMLDNTSLNPQQSHYTKVILNSGNTLLAVINDILDFSKIEAGKMLLECYPFNLREMVETSTAMFVPEAEQKQIRFGIHINSQCPALLMGDPTRLQQVMNNLLSNAFKFTDGGSVDLTINVISVNDNEVKILFKVKDSGIGISKIKQAKLFSAFTQADSSITRNYGGTGLGLAICKQIIDLMGGDIGVDSDIGCGAVFWYSITFKLAELDESSVIHAKKASEPLPLNSLVKKYNQSATILVAEDNPINQQVIKSMVTSLGLNIMMADNGRSALDIYQESENDIDLVLMDLEMPKLDGYSTTQAIREIQLKAGNKNIPIVALTAHVLDENIQRCYDVGMDRVLTKPVKMNELNTLLSEYYLINIL